jgi:hypothetical protein
MDRPPAGSRGSNSVDLGFPLVFVPEPFFVPVSFAVPVPSVPVVFCESLSCVPDAVPDSCASPVVFESSAVPVAEGRVASVSVGSGESESG